MRRLCVLLVAVAMLAALGAGPALAAPAPGGSARTVRALSTDAYCLDGDEQQMLGLINNYRQEHGLAPLSASQTLGAAAEHHSLDMAATNQFSHILSDGTDWSANMDNHGYTYNTYRGENIAAGNASPEDTFTQWQNSPEHNANMLDVNYHAIGIGRAYNADSTYGWYWTTTFGGVADEGARACGEPSTGGQTATTTSNVNLRSGASTTDDVLGVIPSGSTVTITGPAQGNYVPVTYQGSNGWVDSSYLDTSGQGGGTTEAAPTPASGDQTATTLNDLTLRSGPGINYQALDVIPAGDTVTLTGDSQNGFLSVSYNGQDGWASAAYLDTGATPSGGTAIVTTKLNLRDGPSLADAIAGTLPSGATVKLAGQSQNGFVSVSYNGETGWAFGAYLD